MSDYEEELSIDPDKLDEEWLVQAGLYMKYAELHADAVRIRDRLKEKVKVVEAELNLAIRAKPDAYELKEKPTMDAVNAAIISHPDLRKAKEDLQDAEYEANIYNSAIFAIQHKKSALENLVRLHLGEYFTVDGLPRDLSGWREGRREKISDKQTERLEMRRRK